VVCFAMPLAKWSDVIDESRITESERLALLVPNRFDGLKIISEALFDPFVHSWLMSRDPVPKVSREQLDSAISFSFAQQVDETIPKSQKTSGLLVPHCRTSEYIAVSTFCSGWPQGVFWPALTKLSRASKAQNDVAVTVRGVLSINKFPIEFIEFAWLSDGTLVASVGLVEWFSRFHMRSFVFEATQDDGCMPSKIIECAEGMQILPCQRCFRTGLQVCVCCQESAQALVKSGKLFEGWTDWVRFFSTSQNGVSLYLTNIFDPIHAKKREIKLVWDHTSAVTASVDDVKVQYLRSIGLKDAVCRPKFAYDFQISSPRMESFSSTENGSRSSFRAVSMQQSRPLLLESTDDILSHSDAVSRTDEEQDVAPPGLPTFRSVLNSFGEDAMALGRIATQLTLHSNMLSLRKRASGSVDGASFGSTLPSLTQSAGLVFSNQHELEACVKRRRVVSMDDTPETSDHFSFGNAPTSLQQGSPYDQSVERTRNSVGDNAVVNLSSNNTHSTGNEFSSAPDGEEEALLTPIVCDTGLQCKKCDKVFSSSSNFRRHVKALHLMVMKYACEHCGKKFRARSNMVRHVEDVHMGLRQHQCKICELSYPRKFDLQRHLKTSHGVSNENGCLS